MLNYGLSRNKILLVLAAALTAPVGAQAVEVDGFSLGAPKVVTLSRLAMAGPAGALIRCSVNPNNSNEDCRAKRSGTRFALLGIPLEKVFVEFSSGTTDIIEFQFRARSDREQVYAALLQAVAEKFSAPPERYAKGVRWEGDGCVTTLRLVEGGGVSLLLMKMNGKAHEPSSNIASERRRSGLVAADIGKRPTRSSV